jgi:hypothetical protein
LSSGTKSVKKQLAKIVLWFLGRGFEASAGCDSKVIEEVDSWKDHYSILIKIEGHGPCLFMEKKNSSLKYCGNQEAEADLSIFFKNIDAALLVLTGRIGIDTAFAQHRFVVKGDIMESMSLVRCLCIVENYLFPKFITKKILRNAYKKETSSIMLYIRAIFRITNTSKKNKGER